MFAVPPSMITTIHTPTRSALANTGGLVALARGAWWGFNFLSYES
jgi:hypothetical protein